MHRKSQNKSKNGFSRRKFLRGALAGGVTLHFGVPILESMLNSHGTAFADGSGLPKRFGVWFFAGGVNGSFSPQSVGANFTFNEELKPLERHRNHVTVVSNLNAPSFGDYGTNRHIMGPAGGLTGHPPSGGAMTAASIDQLVAESLNGGIRKSLEVGVCPHNTSEQGSGWDNISHNGPNNPNPAILNPAELYGILAGIGFNGQTPAPGNTDAFVMRQSVLDAVKSDADSFRKTLSKRDQARLDEHLEGVFEIEKELANAGMGGGGGAACVDPAAELGNIPNDILRNEGDITTYNRVMSKLLATALSCNITQVFSFQFTRPNAFVSYSAGDFDSTHHEIGHHQGDGRLPGSIAFTMDRLADLMDALKIPDVNGTVLDNTGIILMSDVARFHDMSNMPTLMLGRAGGALKGNQHIVASGPTTLASFTVAKACGATLTSFGTDDAQVSTPLAEALT